MRSFCVSASIGLFLQALVQVDRPLVCAAGIGLIVFMPGLAGENRSLAVSDVRPKFRVALSIQHRQLHLLLEVSPAFGAVRWSELIIEVEPVVTVRTPEKHGRHSDLLYPDVMCQNRGLVSANVLIQNLTLVNDADIDHRS
jgi:hypothetical protein